MENYNVEISSKKDIAVNTDLEDYIEYDDGSGNNDAIMEDFGIENIPAKGSAVTKDIAVNTDLENYTECLHSEEGNTFAVDDFEDHLKQNVISRDSECNDDLEEGYEANSAVGIDSNLQEESFLDNNRMDFEFNCQSNIECEDTVTENLDLQIGKEEGIIENFHQVFIDGDNEHIDCLSSRNEEDDTAVSEPAEPTRIFTKHIRRRKKCSLADLKRKQSIKKKLKAVSKNKQLKTIRKTEDLNLEECSDPEILLSYKDRSKRYKCHLCCHTNDHEVRFHRHVQKHFRNDSNLCPCGIKFGTHAELMKHRQSGHSSLVMSIDQRADLKKRLMQAAKMSMDPLSTKNDSKKTKRNFNKRQKTDPCIYSKMRSKYKLKIVSIQLEMMSESVLECLKANNGRITGKNFNDFNKANVSKKIDLKNFFKTRKCNLRKLSERNLKVCECGAKFTAIVKYNTHYKEVHSRVIKKQNSDLTNMVYEAIKKASSLSEVESGKLRIFDPKMASLLESGILNKGLVLSGVKLATFDGKSIHIELDGSDSLNRNDLYESSGSNPIFTYNSNVLKVTRIPHDNEYEYDAWNIRRFSFANTLKSTNCNLGSKIIRLGQLKRLCGPVVQKPRIVTPKLNTVTIKKEENYTNNFPLKTHRALDNIENNEKVIKAMCSLTRVSSVDVIKSLKKKHKRNSVVKKARPRLVIQRITSSEAERRQMSLKMSHYTENFNRDFESRKINIIDSAQVLYDALNNRYILVQ